MTKRVPIGVAAKKLNLSQRTVREWIAAGKIRATRPGRKWLIDESEIQRLLEASPADLVPPLVPVPREGQQVHFSGGSWAKESATDSVRKEHFDELLAFGRRFRDRLKVDDPATIVSRCRSRHGEPHRIGAQADEPLRMWDGTPVRWRVDDLPEAERPVEEEWGFPDYDATEHSQYAPFRDHLKGHQCWEELRAFREACSAFYRACHMAYERLEEKVAEKMHDNVHPDPADETPAVIATALLADAWYGSRYDVPLFVPTVTAPETNGAGQWLVGLGGWWVSRPSLKEADSTVASFQTLYAEAVSHELLKAMIKQHTGAVEHRETFRKSLADPILRKVLANSHCDLCP